MNIFKSKYSDLFTMYGYSIDTIGCIANSIGCNLKDYNKKEIKEKVIEVINELLLHDIIYVSHWGEYNNILKELELDISQTIKYISIIWDNTNNYIDLEGIVSFSYSEWYLEKININIDTDWNWFSTIFVPNMNKWIKK